MMERARAIAFSHTYEITFFYIFMGHKTLREEGIQSNRLEKNRRIEGRFLPQGGHEMDFREKRVESISSLKPVHQMGYQF